MKKNLVLIGMMGSGKSTISKVLSKQCAMKLIDTDNLIENHSNMKIKDIFREKGELFFRDLEEKIILKTMQSSGSIIALGGGSFLNTKIRKEIKKNGISFWLNWNENTLLNRIKRSKKRPKIDKLNEKEIVAMISVRSKTYAKADYKINCEEMNKFQIAKKIIKIYEKK